MPMYHINVRTESRIASTVDVERESLTELRIEMARYVGELRSCRALWMVPSPGYRAPRRVLDEL
jgi:hypothetical protein